MTDVYYAVAHREQAEIDSFKTRYDDFDDSVIAEIFQKKMGLKAVSWQKSKSWGTSHVIYFVKTQERDDELVFRANLGVNLEPEGVMLVEKLVTDQVAALGVPTNRVLEVDISRQEYPFDYQIQEKIVGQDIEDHFTGTQAEYDALSYELGVLVAKMGELTYDKFGKFDENAVKSGKLIGTKETFYDYLMTSLDGDLEYLQQDEILTAKQAEQIKEVFENSRDTAQIVSADGKPAKGVLVHHDLADHNLMFAKGAAQDTTGQPRITAIFDWEACVVGDPVLDLASCPTWRTHHPRTEQLLAGYTSVRALPKNFQAKWDLYTLRTMLWKMVFAVRMKIVTEARVKRFEQALVPFGV